MRICVVYDCLYPYTVGGAERWYRGLVDELVGAGHEVTYLTRRQWAASDPPAIRGVRVVGVSTGGSLYTPSGRRTISSPLRFGLGVLRHILQNRDRYDVVHSCAFPFFSLLAIRLALAGRDVTIGIDWFEVWTAPYWSGYLGRVGGAVGHAVQRLCARLTPHAFVFSELHLLRLQAEGLRGPAIKLGGLYAGTLSPATDRATRVRPLVVFAGRHIREKNVVLVPATIALLRARLPDVRCLILGDGPERERVMAAIAEHALGEVVQAPGFVDAAEVRDAVASASCLLLPSVREGYGLVVIEAAAAGTPSVVVVAPDNAAVELVTDGINGAVAPAADPGSLADAVARVIDQGEALRQRTREWFTVTAPTLTIPASAARVTKTYERASTKRPRARS